MPPVDDTTSLISDIGQAAKDTFWDRQKGGQLKVRKGCKTKP